MNDPTTNQTHDQQDTLSTSQPSDHETTNLLSLSTEGSDQQDERAVTSLAIYANRLISEVEYSNTPEEFIRLWDFIQHAKRQIRTIEQMAEPAMIALLQRVKANTGNDLAVGDIRYYVGPEKKTKCRDVRATLTKLFEYAAGDIETVANCLSSDALKPGACKEVLPGDVYADSFAETVKLDIKTGKPAKSIHRTDDRFSKPKITKGETL